MSAFQRMDVLRRQLATLGIHAVLPDSDDDVWESLSPEQVATRKRIASLRHMRRIQDRRTVAVLIANVDKYGVHDYIGPNAFAELAIAIASRRRVFLLQGFPNEYAGELEAWKAIRLCGDLSALVDFMTALQRPQVPSEQLALFA